MIHTPQANEYPPFAARYISLVPGPEVLELLEKSKDTVYNIFANMTEEKALSSYGEGKWTLKQMLGHMIDTERTFAYRALVFSRNHIELPGFDQDVYVNNTDFNSQNIKDLAEEFRALRQANLYMVKAFSDEQLARTGIASNHLFTVAAFVFMLAGHERH